MGPAGGVQAGEQVTGAAAAAPANPWLARLARLGLGSRGLVYLLVGYLAVRITISGAAHNPQDST